MVNEAADMRDEQGPAAQEGEGGPPEVMPSGRHGPNWVVTLLWYLFIGSWLSLVWSFIAWLLLLTVIGLPLGHAMLSRLPQVAALQPALRTNASDRPAPAHWLLRVVYFVLIGWWFVVVWLAIAWLLSVTLIGLPLAIRMWNCAPAITSLARY